MFSMGGGPGGITGGPSSMASNAAAGLPAADVPGELRTKVEKVLENESDPATKRNAFLMLFHCAQDRAAAFLSDNLDQVSL